MALSGRSERDIRDALTARARRGPANDTSIRRGGEGALFGRNIHESLANILGTEIVGGVHVPGALLPNEFEMRERFSVSRTALREAYRVLTAKGLIVSRPKVGTRVRPKSDWNMLDPEVLAWHLQTVPTEAFVTDLFALRQMVEPPAAAMAATLRPPDAVTRIEAAYGEMERFQSNAGDIIDADLRFHLAILEATGNHFIGALGSLIHAALLGSFKLGWESPVKMQENRLVQHRQVFEAIRDGRAAAAEDHMRGLLRDSIGDVREFLRRRGAGSDAIRPPHSTARPE
jgi:GntR family galactonate operon transcriptional repressor